MDWKTGQKLVGFHENQRNRFEPILSIFSKLAGELKILKTFEIKNSKKTRADLKIFGQNRI
jgi:hypothetical protein